MHSLYEFCNRTQIYIYIYIYTRIFVQYWRSCTPVTGLFLGSARFLCWMPLCVSFGLPIVSCSVMNSLKPGCLWLLVFVSNNIYTLGILRSAISYLPGCFCTWTFFQNIGFNMVPSQPFMSHLATQLQALQLIVLVAFGVVDLPLASCMLIHHLEIDSTFEQQLGYRFDIMNCKS